MIGGEQVEILIINDGSQDQTQEIAERLASKYPSIVRAIYQGNKGHGGAVIVAWQRPLGAILKWLIVMTGLILVPI